MQLRDENKKKNIAFLIMILTLMVCVTGATYAYFTITPAINNSVQGIAATAELELTITRISPTSEDWSSSSKVMTPQLESDLAVAMGSSYGCVDTYENVICQVYQIELTNVGTAQVVVDGNISFSGIFDEDETSIIMPNLKWRYYTSSDSITGTEAATYLSSVTTHTIPDTVTEAKEEVLIEDDLTLKPDGVDGDTKYYYMVLWIDSLVDENGNQLTQTDHGTYKVTVDFRSSNGVGVTSTFTS